MSFINREFLIETVTRATTDVFDTMLNVPAKAENTYVANLPKSSFDGIITFIGMAGPWAGTGSFCCSVSLACKLAGSLLMSEFRNIDDEVLDAMAELTNMIMGNVKTELEEVLGPMGLSIPTVIYGRNFMSRAVGSQEWIVVSFDCEGERFDIQICLAPAASHARMRHPFLPNMLADV